jgi:dipeptidyl aminopeptidase/acylaminoacyl peptidase
MLLALEALPDEKAAVQRPYDAVAASTLFSAQNILRERAVLNGWLVGASPDGKLLATAFEDGMVRVWDAASGTERAVLKGHSELVESAAFSPDGKLIATASSDNTARLWDVASGTERGVLKDHTDDVRSVAFSPDGRLLATERPHGAAVGYLRGRKAAVPRCLTPEQRGQFGLPLEPPKWCIEMRKWPY